MYTYDSSRPVSGLSIDDFDYELPPERIAQVPIEPRDAARLLVALGGGIAHRHVRDLASFVREGDVLVLNETRVIPARLRLRKPTGGSVEVLLVDRDDDGIWLALVRPSKKVAPGSVLVAGPGLAVAIGAVRDGGQRVVTLLDDDGNALDDPAVERALDRHGVAPLPPYISVPLADPSRYQTTFARQPGSAAAPTAGLHLTAALLDACRARGASIHTVNLSVGLDTFRPVTVSRPEDHEIHSERFSVPQLTLDACAQAKANGGRIIAVGTTSVRALESAAAAGVLEGRTRLFIYGNYPFRLVDVLMTNFHLPRSSLLLLVDAFCGPIWREVYVEAIRHRYRFLSFGDAMLLERRATR